MRSLLETSVPQQPAPVQTAAHADGAPAVEVPLPTTAQPVRAVAEQNATRTVAPNPTEQLAPVLVSVANDPGGARHMTLQLQPDALGQLRIQIDRAPDGPIQVRVEAERPETLTLLQRDTPQLQRALDLAGVPRDTMTLSFHAPQTVIASPTAPDSSQTSSQFLGTGQSYQGFGEGRGQRFAQPALEPPDAATAPASAVTSISARSGIDITA